MEDKRNMSLWVCKRNIVSDVTRATCCVVGEHYFTATFIPDPEFPDPGIMDTF